MSEFLPNEIASIAEEIRQNGLGPYDDSVLRPLPYAANPGLTEAYQEAVSIWGSALGGNISNRKTVRLMGRLKRRGLVDGATMNVVSVLALQDVQDTLYPERLLGSSESRDIFGFPAHEAYEFEPFRKNDRLRKAARSFGKEALSGLAAAGRGVFFYPNLENKDQR